MFFRDLRPWRLKESANGKSAQDNALEMQRRFAALPGVIVDMPRCNLGIIVSERRVADYEI